MSRQFHGPVVVAMAIMWVMQPSIHEVVNVITVRHGFVSAVRAVRVRAPGVGCAARGVGVVDLDNMFVDMIAMRVMQMAIVEVIDVVMMAHSCVSTARTMLMSVIRMMRLVAKGHVCDSPILGTYLVTLHMQRELKTTVYRLRDIAIEQSEEGGSRPRTLAERLRVFGLLETERYEGGGATRRLLSRRA